ncbi:internal virion protein [Enterobacter phage 01_vB_Eclo_IJM]|nr:internal virion protein [Enterobacter phage 01_vB_Eclo_IJM]
MEQLRVKTGRNAAYAVDDEINVKIQNGEFRTRGRWRSIATSDFRMPLSLTLKRLGLTRLMNTSSVVLTQTSLTAYRHLRVLQ